jgi:Holliday junction resolvasome RuvABC endonuclease subunit
MRIVGIDPGLKGAIACVEYEVTGKAASYVDHDVFDMPVRILPDGRKFPDAREIRHMLASMQPDLIIFEDNSPRNTDARSTLFRFGIGTGITLGECVAHGDDAITHLVPPSVWKARTGLSADKDKSLDAARNIFPDAAGDLSRKMDDGRAEALLLTEYWRAVLLPAGEMECI